MEDMEFTRGLDWERFSVYLHKELAETGNLLMKATATEAETQQLRGRAAYIKKLLGLGKGPGRVPADSN